MEHARGRGQTNFSSGDNRPAWGGTVNGLRLAVSPGAEGSDFALDWFRLVQPGSGAPLTWSNAGLGASEYVWDTDADDANNLTSQTGWGVVDIPDVTGSSGTADLSALPPGSFRIGVRSREGFSGWQSVSLASPLPRFIAPNAVGDRDYASTVLRDPWDLNSASDVAKVGGAKNVSFANGQLAATNTSNDAFVSLRIGAGGIDSRTYRNLTVTSAYDGPFDLRDIAGGGTMARVHRRAARQPSSRTTIAAGATAGQSPPASRSRPAPTPRCGTQPASQPDATGCA